MGGHFAKVYVRKPKASRDRSRETFLVGKGFRREIVVCGRQARNCGVDREFLSTFWRAIRRLYTLRMLVFGVYSRLESHLLSGRAMTSGQ